MSRARARGSSVTLLRERALLLRGQPARGQHALVWGLRGIVALEDPAADAPLGHELADRAEEVVLQTQQPIQALQDAPGRARAVASGPSRPGTFGCARGTGRRPARSRGTGGCVPAGPRTGLPGCRLPCGARPRTGRERPHACAARASAHSLAAIA